MQDLQICFVCGSLLRLLCLPGRSCAGLQEGLCQIDSRFRIKRTLWPVDAAKNRLSISDSYPSATGRLAVPWRLTELRRPSRPQQLRTERHCAQARGRAAQSHSRRRGRSRKGYPGTSIRKGSPMPLCPASGRRTSQPARIKRNPRIAPGRTDSPSSQSPSIFRRIRRSPRPTTESCR